MTFKHRFYDQIDFEVLTFWKYLRRFVKSKSMFKEEKRLKLESGNTCPKCEGKGYSIFYYDRMDPRGPTTSELVDDGKKFDCKFCRGKGVINLEDIRERFRHDERRETEVKRIKEAMTKFDNWTSLIYVFGQDTVDELQDELKEEGKI